MADMTTAKLSPRPGYSLFLCVTSQPKKKEGEEQPEVKPLPQEGRHVLRADYVEMRELRRVARWQKAWTQALEQEDDDKLNQVYKDLVSLIPAWDFVDRNGEPLPQPEQSPFFAGVPACCWPHNRPGSMSLPLNSAGDSKSWRAHCNIHWEPRLLCPRRYTL